MSKFFIYVSALSALLLFQVDVQGQVGGGDNYPDFIRAQKEIILSAAVQGLVEEVYCQPQDYVKAGAPLIKLDSDMVEMEIASVTEQLRLSTVEKEAEIKLKYNEDNLAIMELLHNEIIGGNRVGSEKEYKEAVQSRDMAREGVKRAELEVAILRIKLAAQKKTLGFHTIKAPTDGVIVSFKRFQEYQEIGSLDRSRYKKVEVGEMMVSAQPAIAMLKVDRMLVSKDLPTEMINDVRLGQSAKVYVDGGAEPVDATVVYKSPIITGSDGRTFYIKVEFVNPPVAGENLQKGEYPFKYRPGTRARVEIAGR